MSGLYVSQAVTFPLDSASLSRVQNSAYAASSMGAAYEWAYAYYYALAVSEKYNKRLNDQDILNVTYYMWEGLKRQQGMGGSMYDPSEM